MKLGSAVGTRKLVEKYPGLMDATVSSVVKMSFKLLVEGTLWEMIKTQKVLVNKLESRIESINFGKERAIVQVGANDGQHSDPIRHILVSREMRAVLVEPVPVAFGALSRLYANRDTTQLVNVAISGHGGPMIMYVPKVKGNELQSSLWTCRSKEQALHEVERNMGRRVLQRTEVAELRVKSQSASELCKDCGLEPKDVAVLICDTEGQDAEVVSSFLDAESLPELIFYEQLHVPSQNALALRKRLSGIGYSLDETHKDVLASKSVPSL